jgi:glutathione S-transferase
MHITLHHFPGACSRVTMNALEEIGVAYDDVGVNMRTSAQKSPEYLAVNPKGKVPAIVFDGQVMTENAAILWHLHRQYPDAGLLPRSGDPLTEHQGLSDLVWCSGTIHPIVRQIRMPIRYTSGDPEGVKADGVAKFSEECTRMSDRIGDSWWYGDDWSIIDTYLYWAYSTAQSGGFELDRFPALIAHGNRVQVRPAFMRAQAREQAALERMGIA